MGHHWTDYYTDEQLEARERPFRRAKELDALGWGRVGDFDDHVRSCPTCRASVVDENNNIAAHTAWHVTLEGGEAE